MNKSAPFMVSTHPTLVRVAVVVFALGFLTIVPATLVAALRPELLDSEAIARVVAALLWIELAGSISVMVLATRVAWRNRAKLTDWQRFLLITWVVPYFGVTAMLTSAFVEQMRADRISR